jgi:hypothetical protein
VSMRNGEARPPGLPQANSRAPRWLEEDARSRAVRPTVAALCEKFSAVCESAVDSLEIASALEFDGFSDQFVRREYGLRDVFALARAMYLRVPRRPADPAPAPDPWQMSWFRPLLHGLLYALPAVAFPVVGGMLGGPGVVPALVLALLVAWGLSQGLACVGYLRRAGSADEGQVKRVLRAGLAAGLVLVALTMLTARLALGSHPLVLFFGAGEGAYMLGACVLMVLGAETWLPVALVPGVAGAAVFLSLGRPSWLAHLTWISLAATPLAACLTALAFTRGKPSRTGPLLIARELGAAIPAIVFGVVAAGLLVFPVVVGPEGHGGFNTGALLASLPLSLSMGAAEWSLLWYRRRTRGLLGSITTAGAFRLRSRLALLTASLQYACCTAALIAAGAAVAAAAGLARPGRADLPEMVAYLMLGTAMFLTLLLQTMRVRAVPLLAAAAGLAAEVVLRGKGMVTQVITPAVLLAVIGGFAVVFVGAAVRHG